MPMCLKMAPLGSRVTSQNAGKSPWQDGTPRVTWRVGLSELPWELRALATQPACHGSCFSHPSRGHGFQSPPTRATRDSCSRCTSFAWQHTQCMVLGLLTKPLLPFSSPSCPLPGQHLFIRHTQLKSPHPGNPCGFSCSGCI